jgi:putative ABC transport system permease protein
MVLFSVKDPEKSEQYSAEIQQKLLSRKSGNLQVRIDSIYKNMKNVSIIFMVATLGAAVITSVGLIVSGIGIMNVLLMSIAERKWEIGLRKAVGADNKSILLQFLMESILLCIMGALIGLLLSVGIIEVLSFFAKLSIKISWVSVVISVGFCSFVGVFFGIFPAIKASKLDPLECLEQ